MTWARLDDGMLQNPKIAEVGALGFAVHAAGIVYCSQNLTDGFVPWAVAPTLLNFANVGVFDGQQGDDATVLKIIVEGVPGFKPLEGALWNWREERRGWVLHDYLEYNPSRDEVEALREKRRTAGSIGGHRKAAKHHAKPLAPDTASATASALANGKQSDSKSVPRPPTPTNTSLVSHSERGHPQPVDDEELRGKGQPLDPVAIKRRAVLERIVDIRTQGIAPNTPGPYRTKVLAQKTAEHGAELDRLLERYPDAPIESLAGQLLGEPNSLHLFRRKAEAS